MVWAASFIERRIKSFLITVKESPSTTRHQKPIIRVNSNDFSHARASAMNASNASATSSIRQPRIIPNVYLNAVADFPQNSISNQITSVANAPPGKRRNEKMVIEKPRST
ncbi:uncharacterized protein [Gossypium hirsutum]|uniref:Uncharacterized protein isoform X2 n=1 Tax=Gossypium hirsutum TaxID=3635 RepID=A0ABM2YZ81_GOSHI|nr:uncharacterized protein LOC107927596 isoform X2 [Gossypium hirsutum]